MTEMQSKWAKVGVGAAIVVLILSLLVIIKYQYDTITRQEAIQNSLIEMKQLQDGVVRSQSRYVTKEDLEKFAKDNDIDLEPIRKDLATLDAKIEGIGVLVVSTPGYNGVNLGSTRVIPRPDAPPQEPLCVNGKCPDLDPYDYQLNTQALALREPFSDGTQVPFGEARFKAWEKNPWELDIHKRKYSVTTVLGHDDDGRHYPYHKFTITSEGKTYTVKIDESKFVEEYPAPSFSFNPKIELALDVGAYVYPTPAAEVMPNLRVSFFSYGKTKVNPTWKFLSVGGGYESQANRFGVILAPFGYNLGDHIPLIDNFYISPSVSVNTDGGVAVMSGIAVGL